MRNFLMRTARRSSSILSSPVDITPDVPLEARKVLKLAHAPPRFRAFPDDTWITLKRGKPIAGVDPILKLFDGYMIAGLAAGTAGEERPRDINHVRRAFALVKQRRPALGAEASARLCLCIFEASNASLALHDVKVLAPRAYIGRVRGAVRATALH